MFRLFWVLLSAATVCSAAVPLGDSARGAQVFQEQKCIVCHSVNGKGGKSAPDLGQTVGRGYTPATLAAQMWNHAPKMWESIERASLKPPKLTTQQAADLYAYFYSARFFEKKGDAARGKKLFAEKGCAGCHQGAGGGAPDVSQWPAITDPIELARQMWNHSPQMKGAMEAKKTALPKITADEMNDITVYLQSLPTASREAPKYVPASAATGEELFRVKGCAGCHAGAKGLGKSGPKSNAELAAALWNHPGKAPRNSELRPEEMTRLIGYVWSLQFINEGGNAVAGEKAFASKGCRNCHGSGMPRLAHGEGDNSFGMLAVLWSHGPQMLGQMRAKGMQWPAFGGSDIVDLLAYMKSKK
ncbi:MAG: c-type cytochrome [Bryobacteraceae bacterium]